MEYNERRTTFKVSCDLDEAFRAYIEKRHGQMKKFVIESILHGVSLANSEDFRHLVCIATPKARDVQEKGQISIYLPIHLMHEVDSLARSLGSTRANYIEASMISFCATHHEDFDIIRDYPVGYFRRLKRCADFNI